MNIIIKLLLSKISLLFIIIFSIHCNNGNILELIETIPSTTTTPLKTLNNQICYLNNENEIKSLLDNLQQQQKSTTTTTTTTNNEKYILIKNNYKNENDENEKSFINDIHLHSSGLYGYKLCLYKHLSLLLSSSLSNITIINNDGHIIPYYGRHDSKTFIRFLVQIENHITSTTSSASYQTINGKLDKKAYEHIMEPKIIAYYPDKTAPAFQQFQQASKLMSPNPLFFVVHDPQLAAKFRLNQPGQISLVRRLEKSQLFFTPSSSSQEQIQTITAQDIVQWIQKNRGLVIQELKDNNLYDPEIHDSNKYQLIAVGDKSTPLGLYFFKILTKTIQNISRENEMKLNPSILFNEDNDNDNDEQSIDLNENINQQSKNKQIDLIDLNDIKIIWIDLQQFPLVAINLKNLYQIESFKNVWFGLIHSPTTTSKAIWFDLNNLNLTRSDHRTDQENIWLVRNWILTVTDHNLKLNQSSTIAKNKFILEPESLSVRNGGNFLLECRVLSDYTCSWLKNSQPILIDNNNSRYYYVINNRMNGDCSLMINNAQIDDEGEWICTIDNTNDKSSPISVNIRTNLIKNEF